MKTNLHKAWTKSYSELTESEKRYVSEWCETPEDFESIKHFMVRMEAEKSRIVEPSPDVKKKLLNQFPAGKEKSNVWLNFWLLFSNSENRGWALAIAGVALIFGLFVLINPFEDTKKQLSMNEQSEESERREEFESGKKVESEANESDKEDVNTEKIIPVEQKQGNSSLSANGGKGLEVPQKSSKDSEAFPLSAFERFRLEDTKGADVQSEMYFDDEISEEDAGNSFDAMEEVKEKSSFFDFDRRQSSKEEKANRGDVDAKKSVSGALVSKKQKRDEAAELSAPASRSYAASEDEMPGRAEKSVAAAENIDLLDILTPVF